MLLLLQLVTKSWKLERIEGGLAMTDYKADFPGCSRGALKPSVARLLNPAKKCDPVIMTM
jgi:hypothetical protein